MRPDSDVVRVPAALKDSAREAAEMIRKGQELKEAIAFLRARGLTITVQILDPPKSA